MFIGLPGLLVPFPLLLFPIVIPCGPAGVQLHVKLSLLPGQLVVLRLLFSGQCVPPSAQDLVDGCTFFQRALSYDLRSHFLHIQHERVKGFLYVGLLLLFFLFGVLMLCAVEGADVTLRGFLLDCGRDYGRVGDAGRVESVMRRDHVGREPGHGSVDRQSCGVGVTESSCRDGVHWLTLLWY